MKLEMYDIRAALSEMFVHILPPLKETTKYMVDTNTAESIVVLCNRLDSALSSLHRLLPREVEVIEGTVEKMLGLEEDEIETGLERLIRDITETDEAINGKEEKKFLSKEPSKKVWTRNNGAQLRLIAGGKKEKGPFNKNEGV